jgi:hypothetical protein
MSNTKPGSKPEKHSWWEAMLNMKGSCKKISFKFLEKFGR